MSDTLTLVLLFKAECVELYSAGGGAPDPRFHAGASVSESSERERQTVAAIFTPTVLRLVKH